MKLVINFYHRKLHAVTYSELVSAEKELKEERGEFWSKVDSMGK